MSPPSLGAWGEARAREHLLAQGYTLLASNWRCREGELDLVAEIEGTLVFVEVKTRRSTAYGRPEEAISARKARHLVQAALSYLEASQVADRDWRVDVIAITAARGPRLVQLEHFVDALHGERA
ncbi:MAG: YraN family protein [Chloroflexi bacterium]|nr:YraN family protein [Chloroflexota bacterium]